MDGGANAATRAAGEQADGWADAEQADCGVDVAPDTAWESGHRQGNVVGSLQRKGSHRHHIRASRQLSGCSVRHEKVDGRVDMTTCVAREHTAGWML